MLVKNTSVSWQNLDCMSMTEQDENAKTEWN